MKSQVLILALSSSVADAFAPPTFFRPTSKLSAVDPSSFHDLPQHVDSLHHFFSSITLADLDVDAVSSAAAPVVDAAPDAAMAADAAAAGTQNGWFGFLTLPIESLLKFINVALVSMGITNAWGVSIITMTVVIKALTFPLTKSQLESTNKMQVS